MGSSSTCLFSLNPGLKRSICNVRSVTLTFQLDETTGPTDDPGHGRGEGGVPDTRVPASHLHDPAQTPRPPLHQPRQVLHSRCLHFLHWKYNRRENHRL